jgi:hypothetical protein
MCPRPSSRSYVLAASSSGFLSSGVVRVVEVRRGERRRGPRSHEHGGARQPPALAQPPCEAHDDEERDADREELRREDRPVLEQPVEVAEVVLVPAPLPPVGCERERHVHEPRDREAEHSEQHPGADRARGGLTREHGAALGIDPQRREERDLCDHPVDVEEPLVPLRPVDEVGPEHCIDVHRRE